MPRLSFWFFITAFLLAVVYAVSPNQLPVVLYKLALVSLGGVVGYWLDRSLFPYARPHNYIDLFMRCTLAHTSMAHAIVCAAVLIRRALIILASILGLTLGL